MRRCSAASSTVQHATPASRDGQQTTAGVDYSSTKTHNLSWQHQPISVHFCGQTPHVLTRRQPSRDFRTVGHFRFIKHIGEPMAQRSVQSLPAESQKPLAANLDAGDLLTTPDLQYCLRRTSDKHRRAQAGTITIIHINNRRCGVRKDRRNDLNSGAAGSDDRRQSRRYEPYWRE